MGQDEALHLVSEAIIKSRSGIKDPNRPIGSFIFLGPTGVGKTEVARTLAYELFDIEKRLSNDQIKLFLTDKAKDYLVDAGYDINYGARPLKREVSKTIESLLAHELIKGTIPFNATVTFDVEDNNLIISKVDVK